jgi:hypothetical protein
MNCLLQYLLCIISSFIPLFSFVFPPRLSAKELFAKQNWFLPFFLPLL